MVDQQIDIITVTYGNMFSVIKRTIDSLHKFTEEPFHVIIVNNGSTDETMTFFNNLSNCTLINLEKNIGLVKGFNTGLKKSTAPFIARMDHDIEFIMPWKKRFLKLLEENKDVGVIGPRIVLPNNKIYFALFSFYFKIPHLPIKFRVNNPLSFPRFFRQFILWEFNNKKEGFNAEMAACSRADIICKNEEMIKKLSEVGLNWLVIGLESGNQRVLDLLKKGTTVEQNYKAAEICKKYKIKIIATFMMGIPTEIKEEVKDTIRMIRTIKPEHPSPFYFTPIPGTDIYDYCVKNDLLLRDDPFDIERTGDFVPKIKGVDYKFLDTLRTSLIPTWQRMLRLTMYLLVKLGVRYLYRKSGLKYLWKKLEAVIK